MLSSELKKLKKKLEGEDIEIDSNLVLKELNVLERLPIKLNESLSLTNDVCNCCGRKF